MAALWSPFFLFLVGPAAGGFFCGKSGGRPEVPQDGAARLIILRSPPAALLTCKLLCPPAAGLEPGSAQRHPEELPVSHETLR